MLYFELVNRILCDNEIRWNYYNNSKMPVSNILQANQSRKFISEYFNNGSKYFTLLLPPMLNLRECEYPFESLMMSIKDWDNISLPDDRAIHTVSGFFLGLLIEKCLNGERTLAIKLMNTYEFTYLWFLMFLYHDYGYCITEREKAPITVPPTMPIQGIETNLNYTPKEYSALRRIKKELDIDFSPYSYNLKILKWMDNIIHNCNIRLRNDLQPDFNEPRHLSIKKIKFNNNISVPIHRYASIATTRYFNYCINELHKVDHGIIGGYLFFDRILKNYLISYFKTLIEQNTLCYFEDFTYNNRRFNIEQLPIFSYIADCIISHNIWKQPEDKRTEYEYYKLHDLLDESFKNITYQDNPLLYILVVADSLEPTKIYKEYPPEQVAKAIDVNFKPSDPKITFTSINRDIPIETLYRSAKGLESWTSIRCSEIDKGIFTLLV